MLRTFYFGNFASRIQAPKGVKERVKSPYSVTSAISHIHTHSTHKFIHTHIYALYALGIEWIRITILFSEVQSDRASLHLLQMVAGCYVNFLRCMLCYNQDATIRPVLKHGPRSSTGLRVVEFITKLVGEAKAKLCEVILLLQHRLITDMHRACCVHTFIFHGKRLIKLKSTLVETRKMVNYARTWWSQVKTWWKLALCGTDVQIVAAWPEYRGERLIEPSSSWFPPKFPSG